MRRNGLENLVVEK